jgi:hypothetical protein
MNISISKKDKKGLLYGADGFSCKEEASDYLDSQINYLSNILDDNLTLYRAIFVDSERSINLLNIGNHWVENESLGDDDHFLDYLKNECMGEILEGDAYIIKAIFKPGDVDVMMTLAQNLLNPHEEEIFIKTGSKPIGYVSIKQVADDNYKLLIPDINFDTKFENNSTACSI